MKDNSQELDRKFSVAPMLDWTDKHCRHFHRILSKKAVLYTEMVTSGALLHGKREVFLQHNPIEYPLAFQLGGHDASELAQCALIVEKRGYQEINLNIGCPSNRVQKGKMGACLMAEPATVAKALIAMREAVDIPVTVKHRIGINGRESYQQLVDFVGQVSKAGCNTFIVHARIAVLEGLTPKKNRNIPPLKPDWVYQLKQDFPDLEIIINGGIKFFKDIAEHMLRVDGVMIGREAYQNPYMLAEVDNKIYGCNKPAIDRFSVIERLVPYIELQLSQGIYLNHMTRHILGLFQGIPGARGFRRHISKYAHKQGAKIKVLLDAVQIVENHIK